MVPGIRESLLLAGHSWLKLQGSDVIRQMNGEWSKRNEEVRGRRRREKEKGVLIREMRGTDLTKLHQGGAACKILKTVISVSRCNGEKGLPSRGKHKCECMEA